MHLLHINTRYSYSTTPSALSPGAVWPPPLARTSSASLARHLAKGTQSTSFHHNLLQPATLSLAAVLSPSSRRSRNISAKRSLPLSFDSNGL